MRPLPGGLWSFLDLASPSCRLLTEPPSPTCARNTTPPSASFPSTTSHSSTLKRRVSHHSDTTAVFFFLINPKVLLIINRFVPADFSQEKLDLLESYMKAVKLFKSYEDPSEDPEYSEVRKLTTVVLLIKIRMKHVHESFFFIFFT